SSIFLISTISNSSFCISLTPRSSPVWNKTYRPSQGIMLDYYSADGRGDGNMPPRPCCKPTGPATREPKLKGAQSPVLRGRRPGGTGHDGGRSVPSGELPLEQLARHGPGGPERRRLVRRVPRPVDHHLAAIAVGDFPSAGAIGLEPDGRAVCVDRH